MSPFSVSVQEVQFSRSGGNPSSEQRPDRLPVFQTNLSTTPDISVPSFVRLVTESGVGDVPQPAAGRSSVPAARLCSTDTCWRGAHAEVYGRLPMSPVHPES